MCTENIKKGVKNVDFIYTDVWVSMGESEKIWKERISLLKNYQVNQNTIDMTNNSSVKVLHCLPALHDKNNSLAKLFLKEYNLQDGMEITDSIFRKNHKIIFEQAENRLHTIKAILISSLVKTINF